MTTLLTSSVSSTASRVPTQSTDQASPASSPASTSSSDDHTHDSSAFNFYFLFLAAFATGITVLLWWGHRRRRLRKERMRLSGQHALARDIEGWTSTQRVARARYHRGYAPVFLRREEGLDEHGDAPPPYQPKSEMTVTNHYVGAAHDTTSGLLVPPPTLPKDEIDRAQPPVYDSASSADPKLDVRHDEDP